MDGECNELSFKLYEYYGSRLLTGGTCGERYPSAPIVIGATTLNGAGYDEFLFHCDFPDEKPECRLEILCDRSEVSPYPEVEAIVNFHVGETRALGEMTFIDHGNDCRAEFRLELYIAVGGEIPPKGSFGPDAG